MNGIRLPGRVDLRSLRSLLLAETVPCLRPAHNVGAHVDASIADERCRPGNQLAHLTMALAAEYAVESIILCPSRNRVLVAHIKP